VILALALAQTRELTDLPPLQKRLNPRYPIHFPPREVVYSARLAHYRSGRYELKTSKVSRVISAGSALPLNPVQ